MTTPPKTRFPLAQAEEVGQELVDLLLPACEKIEIAGSIRRRRPDVGDVELLCISRVGDTVALGTNVHLLAEIEDLIHRNVLQKRLNKAGRPNYGDWNRLMIHVASGIPVDIFRTTEANWGMAMVVRTGPAEWNVRMMTRFRKMGMQGHAGSQRGSGVTQGGVDVACRTEQDVFRLLEWRYREPEDRV